MRELLTHASRAFAIKILAAAFSLFLGVALARLLGAESTGHYYLIFTIVTIAALVARSGIDRAALRFVAANNSANCLANISRVYKISVVIVAVIGGIITIALLAGSNALAGRVFSAIQIATPLLIATVAVIPIALSNLHAELLKGLKQTGAAIAIQSAWIPLITIVGVVILVPRMGLLGAILSMLVASLITLTIAVIHWWLVAPRSSEPATITLDDFFRASLPLFWVGLFQLVIAHSATIILGIYQEGAQVGIFAVASRTAGLISFVLFAVNSIAAPKFAELYRQQRMHDLESTAIHSTTLMVLMALPILLLFIFASGSVMRFFGPDFVPGASVLAILAIGQFVNVATGSVAFVLAMTDSGTTLRNVLAASAVLHLILCVTFAPLFGALGVAGVTAFSMALMNIVLSYCVWRDLGIFTVPFLRALGRKNNT